MAKQEKIQGEYYRVSMMTKNRDLLQEFYFTPISELAAEHLIKHFDSRADVIFYPDIQAAAVDYAGNHYIRLANNPLTTEDIENQINQPRLTLGVVLHEISHLIAGNANGHNFMFIKEFDKIIDKCKDNKWKEIVEKEIANQNSKKKIAKSISKILELKCPTCGKVPEIKSTVEDDFNFYHELSCGHIMKVEKVIKNDRIDSFKSINNEPLYNFQKENVDKFKDANGRLCIFDEMGLGKGGLITDLVFTPIGTKSYGELKVNDQIIGSDGKSYSVTGIFPRGLQQTYKITFSDNSQITVDAEHLWAVNTPIRKWRNQENKVIATRNLIGDLSLTAKNSSGKLNNKWYIPIVKLVEFEAQNIPIEPYLLGVLLGDGYIGGKSSISIASTDPEIITECFEGLSQLGLLFADLELNKKTNLDWKIPTQPLKQKLELLKLWKHKADSKFVPECYKFNTIQTRLAILQGLMDTDGWTSEDIKVTQYTTISKQLANDVVFLVQSLGGTCKVSSKIPTFLYKGEKKEGQLAYTVTINLELNPFRLRRKQIQYENRNRKYKPTRAIVSIEDAGMQETICISTDAPDQLYVTNDFIVTHNTPSSIAISHIYSLHPTLIICKAGLRHQWQKMTQYWGNSFDDLCIPEHSAQVIENSKDFCMQGSSFYIVSFDLLPLLDENFFKIQKTVNGKEIPLDIKLAIVDECQHMKNPDTARTRAVFNHCKGIPNVVFLSGTPIKNSGIEFYPTLHMIDPIKFPNKSKFASDWVDCAMQGPYIKYGGIRNFEKFQKATEKFIIRHTQTEVLPDLPEITRNFIYTDLEGTEANEYYDTAKQFQDYYYKTSKEDAEFYQNILAFFVEMRHITGRAKVKAAIDFTIDFLESTDRKLAIFTHHIDVQNEVLEGINKYLQSKGMKNCLLLFGGMDGNKKEELKDKFNFNPDYRILVASTLASGEGHNLQHACSDCLMLERQWNPPNEEQAEFRFKRPGQKSSVITATYLLALETIDEYFTKLVEDKRMLVKHALDGVKPDWNQNQILKDLAAIIATRLPKGKR